MGKTSPVKTSVVQEGNLDSTMENSHALPDNSELSTSTPSLGWLFRSDPVFDALPQSQQDLLNGVQLLEQAGVKVDNARLAQWLATIETKLKPNETSTVSTAEIVAAFLKSKQGMVAETSLTSYRHTLSPFIKRFSTLPATPEPIEDYLAGGQFKKKKSVAGAYTVLSMLYKFAEQRYNVPNVMKLIQKPHERQSEPHAFSLDEFKLILAACNDDRELALVHLAGGHGERNAEMCRALVGDIASDRIFIRGKERDEQFPLLPETVTILLRLANSRSAQSPLFISQMKGQLSDRMAYNVVKAILKRAGVLEGKPADWRLATHTLRKTFSSLALAAGCDSRIVKRLLRHKSRDTTDLYLAIPFEHLRQNLEHYSPLRLVNQKPPEKFPKTEY